jgi:hypothetical protein
MLSRKENRRHPRISYAGAVCISWQDERGLSKFTKAKCLDLSQEGLRIEMTEPIPVLSTLLLRAEQINLSGSASVRYRASRGRKYVLGLNLSHAIENPPAQLNL